MAVTCRFFADGTEYGQTDFAKLMKDSMSDGYVLGVEDELKVTETSPRGMSVKVGLGRAYIQGYSVDVEDAPEVLNLETPDVTYPRIDRIVLRLSAISTQDITLAVLTGTPAQYPSPQPLTHTPDIYEIPLAQIRVGAGVLCVTDADITDDRYLAGTNHYMMLEKSVYHGVNPTTISGAVQHHDPVKILGSTWVRALYDNDAKGVYDAINRLIVFNGYMDGFSGLTPGEVVPGIPIAYAISDTEIIVRGVPISLKNVYSMIMNMSDASISANISYGDDADGLNEGARDGIIREHTHFAVVDYDGEKPYVKYWLYRYDLNFKATDETCESSTEEYADLTGADGDVVVLYDQVWWKFTVDGSNVKFTFTFSDPNDNTWVTPHQFGATEATAVLAKYIGMGLFEGVIDSGGKLRSINTNSTPTVNTTQNNFYNAAVNGRNDQYNQTIPATWAWYIIQLYFVKGNRDCQEAYGRGIVGASAVQPVDTDWDQTNAWINGDNADNTKGVTVLGIHNPWGNVSKFLGECKRGPFYNYSGYFYLSTLGGKNHVNIETTNPISIIVGPNGRYAKAVGSGFCQHKNMSGNVITKEFIKYPFFLDYYGADYSAGFADAHDFGPYNQTLPYSSVYIGGDYTSGLEAGPVYTIANGETTDALSNVGSRLHVVIL